MRFFAFATDYDETLAEDGRVLPSTAAALERVRASGRRLLLVTGRELDDLLSVFPQAASFDAIVAENGAVLHQPEGKKTQQLGGPRSEDLVERLRRRGVPLFLGRVVIATRVPHDAAVLEEVGRLGLELQVVFNKGAVMVLPRGVDKASGLAAALRALGLSPRDAVAVGDGENDQVFLEAAGCGAAVANAVPLLRERADILLRGRAAQGVEELIEELLKDDLEAALSAS